MAYRIPLFDLHYTAAEEEAVLRTLTSKWISMGPSVRTFEKRFARHLGARHVVALNSCTAALHLALKLAGVTRGDEVIVPSLTFAATVNAVTYVGAKPVFADVTSLEDFSVDPDDIARKITRRTRAVIPVHYAGFACRMDTIMRIARKSGLTVIEDAAHAPDSTFKGRHLGTIGHMGCFSFFSNKNISCAEGGALVTGDDALASRARLLRSHGMTTLSYERGKGHATRYDIVDIGYNYRLDDIRGALICAQLDKLKADTVRRRRLYERYRRELSGTPELTVPYRTYRGTGSHHLFPVVLKNSDARNRDHVRQQLAARGIETSVHYPAIHRFAVYDHLKAKLPNTDYISDNVFTLPLYYRLKMGDVSYIARSLKDILRNG